MVPGTDSSTPAHASDFQITFAISAEVQKKKLNLKKKKEGDE